MPRRSKGDDKAVVTSGSDNGGHELEPIVTPGEVSFVDTALETDTDMVDVFLGEEDIYADGNGHGRIELPAFDEDLAAAASVIGADAPVAAGREEPAAVVGLGEGNEQVVIRSQKASKLRLGDILKDMALATEAQIEDAIGRQKETRKRLGQILVDDGLITQLDLSKALARKFGVSFLDLTSMTFDGAAAGYIDERLARRYAAAPIRFLDDATLLVAMADPQNLQALEDLRLITGFDVQPAIASEEDVFGAIAKIYRERADVGRTSTTWATRASTRIRSRTSATPRKRRPSSSS